MNFDENNKNILSVVIPTLQRNKKVLLNLINTLVSDNAVGEIIIIDNSCQGLDIENKKVRIIIPQENLYVNPSWNLGVKEAKYNIVALFNDDIAVPENFCSDVVSQMSPKMGIIGINSQDCMICLTDITKNPQNTNPVVEKVDYLDLYFGTAMFFFKENYKQIPDNMKIVYGDNWITNHCKNRIYRVSNQVIYHLGSLSSADKTFNPICKKDAKIYKRLTVKWYQRLFSYEKIWDGLKIRIMGITLKFIDKKRRGVRNG